MEVVTCVLFLQRRIKTDHEDLAGRGVSLQGWRDTNPPSLLPSNPARTPPPEPRPLRIVPAHPTSHLLKNTPVSPPVAAPRVCAAIGSFTRAAGYQGPRRMPKDASDCKDTGG